MSSDLSRRPPSGYPSISKLPYCQVLRKDLVQDGAPVYYWQLQYYDSPPDVPSFSGSGFAQTEREADDIFYQTFPNARPSMSPINSQWVPGPIPANCHGIMGTGFYPPRYGSPRSTTPLHAPVAAAASSDCGVQYPARPSTTLSIALSPQPEEKESMEMDEASDAFLEPQDISSPFSDTSTTADELEPSEMGALYGLRNSPTEDIPASFDHLPPSSPSDTANVRISGDIKDEDVGTIQDLNLTPSEVTGTWPSLRVRSHSISTLSPGSNPSPSDSSASQQTLTTYGRRGSTISAASALTPPPTPSNGDPERKDNEESPTVMRISPLPSHKRPLEKKKAQTLACNFCRGRKIACGPPVAGTVEKTCNQCQRRSLKCVFPTECRRGQRKKKAPPPTNDTKPEDSSTSPSS